MKLRRSHLLLAAKTMAGIGVIFGSPISALALDWYSYGGHEYALTTTAGTWDQAEADAMLNGGHLVTINDDAENTWLFNTFNPLVSTEYTAWIGLYQLPGSIEPDQGWVWVNGESVIYTRWSPGAPEPNNQGSNENWAVLFGTTNYGPRWNDIGPGSIAYTPFHGIIEVVPEPTSMAFLGIAAVGLLLRRRTQ